VRALAIHDWGGEEWVRLNGIDWAALVLAAIGAINWGLIALFRFNLVTAIFGGIPALVTIIYILVGLAGLWLIYLMVRASQGEREERPVATR
jgi:uncharacterized membrane protein YuzA (DUF378 family)